MQQHKDAYDSAVGQLTAPGAPFEIEHRTIDSIDYRVYVNALENLPALYSLAAEFGDRDFLVYEGERWSFSRVIGQAGAFARGLQEQLGIGVGDRVAIAMRNYPEWMSSFIAITAIGAVAVPLNSWGKTRELEFALRDAGAKALFCDRQRLDLVAEYLEASGVPTVLVRDDAVSLPAGVQHESAFCRAAGEAALPRVEIDPESPAMILYTSGTTGAPKGALSTHRAICQALASFECAAMASAMMNPETIGAMLESGFEPVQMLAVPLFHVSGLYAVFLTALKAGRRVVMLYKWDPDRALELIASERVTILSAAPSMLMQLLESPAFDASDTSSLFSLGAGGAATPARAFRLIKEKIPQCYAGTGWGMTETNAIGTAFTGHAFFDNPRSAGFPHPTAEIGVRDSDGQSLPVGEAGELWIKSATLISEYWNRPDANASDFDAGWFNSGDIGYFDEAGYLYLSDRSKDMVIRGGENIYPAEIENVLLDHPQIAEAAVFGVPDDRLGEELGAVIVPREGAGPAADDIRRFAADRLAGFKVPRNIWLQREPLPRNASSKILKAELRKRYGDG
jgi:acyl-CoA synthetase (AMP-forming)/AMP-acid ligase II